MKISVVINTFNEEENIGRCLASVKGFADEIVVVDMHSTDKTVKIAKKYQAKVFLHEYTRYVEPARNFALAKTTGDWILLLDADEELSQSLAKKLKEIAGADNFDYVELSRRNIIFGKWIEHSRWWPDYLVRFFRAGLVTFSDRIHLPPSASGKGLKLGSEEENALVHHNFQSISQYLERVNRYSDIQAEELVKSGYKLNWRDLLTKPADEFFSRFFAGEGYKDGLHGLVLALLQSFSELALYLKVWEKEGFVEKESIKLNEVLGKVMADYCFWQGKTVGMVEKIRLKIKAKI